MTDETNDTSSQDNVELEQETSDQFIEPELEDIEESSNDSLKKVKAKLKECESQKMEHLENLQRAKAEFLNAKKRLTQERHADAQRNTREHIRKLLPLCDSFQMAFSNKAAWDAVDPTWKKGVESIHTQLQSLLSGYAVETIGAAGETFDPAIHEALSSVPVQDKKKHHTVIEVVQSGYIQKTEDGEELIRPARVTVGEYA